MQSVDLYTNISVLLAMSLLIYGLTTHLRGIPFKRKLHQADLARFMGVGLRIFAFIGYLPYFMLAEDTRLKTFDYGSWIAFRRKLKGWSAKALADKVGVDNLAVFMCEKHRCLPYPRFQQKILDVFEPLDDPSQIDSNTREDAFRFRCRCSHRRGPRIPV